MDDAYQRYLLRQVTRKMKSKTTKKQLASKIAKLEGKKHQASIGDIREIVKIVFSLIKQEEGVRSLFLKEIGDAL